MFDQELINCFLDEARDTLAQWERACLDLETEEREESFNSLFRAAHNLKGASRSVGLEAFGTFVHQVEDVITLVIQREVPLSKEVLGLLLDSQVFLSDWVDILRADPNQVPESGAIVTRILEIEEGKLKVCEAHASPSSKDESIQAPGQGAVSVRAKSAEEEELEKIFAAAQAEFHSGATGQTPACEHERVVNAEPPAQVARSEAEERKQKSDQKNTKAAEETVRVASHKLDELIQLIGELTIHQSIVFEGRRSGNLQQKFFQNAIMLSHKIVKDLHTTALSLRMQPVQSLFQRLERVARDVARAQSKKISIALEGTEVELDKSVIERITDPLVHIIRNAVDHGIEDPNARVAVDKDSVAKVTLSAVQDASVVNIQVRDDGRGLSTEKVRRKAIEKGLIKEGDALSEREIHNLIFLPGFSTAEKVTDISGRGVGMDVVLRAVQDLQGAIDLSSEEGKGTTFTVTLPTSMSIIDGLVVKVSDLRYVVSMHELIEIIDLSNYTVEHSGSHGRMLSLRGGVIPLESLSNYIRVEQSGAANGRCGTGAPALVVRHGGNLIAFEIDGVMGQQSVVVRPLNEQMSQVRGFSGSTVLGDGEPGMILNLSEIARGYFTRQSLQEQ